MMNNWIVLLGVVAAASALPAHFPQNKIVEYNYTADLKAGAMDPGNFASQFDIQCKIQVQHLDGSEHNVYHVALLDVNHTVYNGRAMHYEHRTAKTAIPPEAKSIELPFLIVYDENKHFQGIKVSNDDTPWSVNIKKAIASALQLDLLHIDVQTPIKPHSFITEEDTIYGKCKVAYNVLPKAGVDPNTGVFSVVKFSEPHSCSDFNISLFHQLEQKKCLLPPGNDLTTASRRVFEIENLGNAILMKNLIAHGVINYIPLQAKSVAHYILANQSFSLLGLIDQGSPVNTENIFSYHNFTYSQPTGEYAPDAGKDVTQGRHKVDLEKVAGQLKELLAEAADYKVTSPFNEDAPDWKRNTIINRIVHVINFMDRGSIEKVYNELQKPEDIKKRNILLGVIPTVGTDATCILTKDLVAQKKVPDQKALTMLATLPMHIKIPTGTLLPKMSELLKLDQSVSTQVRQAGILCFATLIHKTYMHFPGEIIDPLLDEYLNLFMKHINEEPTDEMKTVYVMAMKNVGVYNILKHLKPIINGQIHPQLRRQAIIAVKEVLAKLPTENHNLIWPILSNVQLPLAIRIAAYDVLTYRFHYTARYKNLYWFMVYEKDEDLYNYHVTNMMGIANSVDPCLMQAREMASKILKFTRIRHVPQPLSWKSYQDTIDKYGIGEFVEMATVLNPQNRLPQHFSVIYGESAARRPATMVGIHVDLGDSSEIAKIMKREGPVKAAETVNNENVKNVLSRAASDIPRRKTDADMCLYVTLNNKVVTIIHLDKNNWKNAASKLKNWKNTINEYLADLDWGMITYENSFVMDAPADFGIPAVLDVRMPVSQSMKFNADVSQDSNSISLKLRMLYQSWKDNGHSLSIYNPIADVWHNIQKLSTFDIVIPVDINIVYKPETKSLKFKLPRTSATEFSTAGLKTFAKSFVTVTDDYKDILHAICPECKHVELVSDSNNQKVFEKVFDSKDTGLKYSLAVFDCESNYSPGSPINQMIELLTNNHWNPTGNKLIYAIMMGRLYVLSNMINSQNAFCSNLIKIEPSTLYPTSSVEINSKFNIEHLHDKPHALASQKIDIRGTLSAKSLDTHETRRQWDMNVNIMLGQGHMNQTVKVIINRGGHQEKNITMCIDAQKNYPIIDSDLLKIDSTKQETNTKVKIGMGETIKDKCSYDDLDLTVFIKGLLSDEQKQHMKNDRVNGTCIKQIQNPLLNPDGTHVPKTWHCMHEAILHTTLRKYLIDAVIRKSNLPSTVHLLEDILSLVTWFQADRSNVKLSLEFPVLQSSLHVNLVTPDHSYSLIQLPWGNPVWNPWMDNVHFSAPFLYKYLNGYDRICSIYPRVILTFNNGTIPFVAPSKWTLLVGDHQEQSFAVFVRLAQNSKLDVQIFIGKHLMEIVHSDSGVVVTADNQIVENHEKGITLPHGESNTYAMMLIKNYDHLIIQSKWVPLELLLTPNSVTVVAGVETQGQVSGMCGDMSSTHISLTPKLYMV